MRLKQSKRILKSILKDRCQVFVKKRTRVNGQMKELFVRTEEHAECRLSVNTNRGGADYVVDQRQTFPSPVTIYTLPIEIKQDARIYLKGTWYEVKSVPRNPSLEDHHLELPVEVLDGQYKIIEGKDYAYMEVDKL